MSSHCHSSGCHNHGEGGHSHHSSCHCHCHAHHSGCDCHCASCCKSHHKGDFALNLLDLADEAWYELLKEKIKDYIIESDPKMDELAQLVSEANHNRWKEKIAIYHTKDEFEQRFKELFYRRPGRKL